jgi:hypothetical protein
MSNPETSQLTDDLVEAGIIEITTIPRFSPPTGDFQMYMLGIKPELIGLTIELKIDVTKKRTEAQDEALRNFVNKLNSPYSYVKKRGDVE